MELGLGLRLGLGPASARNRGVCLRSIVHLFSLHRLAEGLSLLLSLDESLLLFWGLAATSNHVSLQDGRDLRLGHTVREILLRLADARVVLLVH